MFILGYRIGSSFKASPSIETSIAGAEVLPITPVNTVPIQYYKLALINDQSCSLIINNDPVAKFIRAGQGFETTEIDAPIFSLKIVEAGITYNWFSAY